MEEEYLKGEKGRQFTKRFDGADVDEQINKFMAQLPAPVKIVAVFPLGDVDEWASLVAFEEA